VRCTFGAAWCGPGEGAGACAPSAKPRHPHYRLGRRGEALSTAAAGPRDEDSLCACASVGRGGSPWGVCRKGGRESGASGVSGGGGDRIARHSAPAAIWNTLHGCRVLSCLCAYACACVTIGRV